ncbi:MAG: site-specific integrase [Candidatus Hydrogenedentota bacterium]
MASIRARKGVDGKLNYTARIRMKGTAEQSATFPRLTDARKWIQATESAIREGRHFRGTESKRHTLGEAIDRYTRDVLPLKKSGIRDQAPKLERWKTEIGNLTLADVTPPVIAEIRDKLLNEQTRFGTKMTGSTVNRYLAPLSHLFSVATRDWGWTNTNPVRGISKPKEGQARVRYLSDDERARLLAACKQSRCDVLYDVVVLALSSGMRRSELFFLRWRDVDFERDLITLHETKNGERRSIPIVGHARELLETRSKIRRIDTDYVFASLSAPRPANIITAWNTVLRKANIENFHFHDLRHSCASYLAMRGATTAELASVLGHRTLTMVKRYAHIGPQHTSRVLAGMVDSIFNSPKAETCESA